ncbi:MAG: hypothetical protein E3J56_05010 [Candidatus Aminicenantes bacterium]|nr:MAG: hypothetical protein E3J56_05010 [Candidatus Aminicenantes bacterium]
MLKLSLATLTLILFLFSFLSAQNNDANQDYIKAVTTENIEQKIELLKEYIAKWAGKGTQNENFVYVYLCLTPYKGKTPKETVECGEKALELGGFDDYTKYQILITVAGSYNTLGQNLAKAKNYAMNAVNIAKANKTKSSTTITPAQWNKFIGAGYYVHGQALEKAKNLRGAVDSYINSYNILKNPQIAKDLKRMGKSLYDFKSYKEAEKAFKVTASVLKDFASIYFYAQTLHRNGKREEALSNYRQAYMKQKSGDIAYNIGIILAGKAKKNPSFSDEAIKYLLDASFLSPANSKKAMQMAESLFFTSKKDHKYNEKIKELEIRSKKLEELTNSFNKKFGEKDEEDLSDAEKKEMMSILDKIEAEQKSLKEIEAEQNAVLDKFNKLIDKTKERLGIK